MDNLEKFNKQLTEIMNNSNLPVSVLKMALQSAIYQLEIIRLSTPLKESKTEDVK